MIQHNVIQYLNNLPSDATVIDLSCKYLEEVPDLSKFTNLKILNIQKNKLTTLTNIGVQIEQINCSNNQIEIIKDIVPSLKTLICKNNKISSFDNPLNIERFECD